MAKQVSPRKPSGSKALVIVESPAKARTISKFLGNRFEVEASIGHVRDLPQGAKQIPVRFKGEPWANLGVNVQKDFEPIYVVSPGKSKQIKKLKDRLKDAGALYLATDEDREGEAISWHLLELLKPKVPVHRLVFHEITEEAIEEALSNPRQLDDQLVRAQETRRILDRLFGYEVSPLLWRKVRPKLSAGRVQSVAVRMIVERERERMAFRGAAWFDLLATFLTSKKERFQAALISVGGKRIPSGKDFDPTTGLLKNGPRQNGNLTLLDADLAEQLARRIEHGTFRVTAIEEKSYTTQPYPPFTTSTLQQESNRKLGFTARRTMQVAQSLYENGHITYMRTDSTNLAMVAVEDARRLVASEYGANFLPDAPRIYKSKVKNAQEAHEAIRPAGHPFELPSQMRSQLNEDEYKLFCMIWKRTIASQMTNARGRRMLLTIEGEGCTFQVAGRTIDFPGYLRAYVEGSDDPNAELADQEQALPTVTKGETLRAAAMEPKEHHTQPPPRYSEAALTKALEEKGIGRPSTYASIIDTIQARQYVFKKANTLVPTWVAFSVIKLLEEHLASLVDYQFTAQMEDDLDTISRGEQEHVEYLHRFYYGNQRPGLKKQLDHKVEEIDAREVGRILIGRPDDGEPIFVRVGRYSPFLEQGDRTASIPENMPPDEVTLDWALEMLDQAAQGDEPLGICPQTNQPIFLKVGRFGPYVQRGRPDGDEKPKNASLLKGMNPDELDLETAIRLLSLPRDLGNHPTEGKPIRAYNGRYGPYIQCGDATRSLPPEMSPLDVTFDQAVQLLAQPKRQGRAATKKEPLQIFENSPVTGQPVQLLDGRYGPYVTDGTTNASVPKGTAPAQISFEQALDLLAIRASKGPASRTRAKKKVAKKPAKKAKKTRKAKRK
ncbi:MAG: type I DNA topoisomerase [Pirellulales bacterium]|nr:type I DNA topoisomerase [Pirellulales bacterium]